MRSRSVVQKNLADVLRFLWAHWRTQSRSVIFVTVALTFGMLADLLLPVFSGRLIDAISAANTPRVVLLHTAIQMLAAMAALGVLLVAARYSAFIGVSRLTVEVMSRMGSDAFWRVQRLSTDWQANNFAGSIIRRITRGMWAADLMNDTLLLALFPASLILTGSSLVLALRWPSMGLLVALASLSYVVTSIALALRWVAPAAHLSNAQDTRIGGALADAVTCNSVVKSFGAEEREEARLHLIFAKWRARTYRHWVYASRSGTAQLLLLVGMRTLVTSYAVYLWWEGRATPGDVTFVLTSYFIIHGYLRDVGQHVANLQRSMNEMEALVTLNREPLAVADAPGATNISVSNGDIVFDRVTFRYEGQSEPLFQNFSLRIKAGERVGLVGHSGSGKTTFVKLLQRLYDVGDGRILIDGQDIAQVTQKSLRSALALVAQEPILFHRSLAENIAYGRPEASRIEVEEAACLANAHDFIRALPKNYRTLVGERGVKLSGGERQRVALARAFLADAPILILDEATSSLDSVSEAAIQDAMERLLVGRTSIVIAHRLATVRMLDRILVFDNGSIVEEGTHDELVRRSGGTYQRLFEKQALGLVATTAAS